MVYWNNIPAPYMVDRFNALADRAQLRFEVWFNDKSKAGRSWIIDESTWRFPFRYVPILRLPGVRLHFGPLLLLWRRPRLLVGPYAGLSYAMGWLLARTLRIKTAFRVLTTFDTWVRRRWFKERLKRFMFSRVDAVETPGADGAAYAQHYGVPSGKIYVATHTVDIKTLSAQWNREHENRAMSRAALSLRGIVYLYVGRLWRGKGVFTLVEAFRLVQERVGQEATLLLVGEGEDENELREHSESHGIHNLVFAGFHDRRSLARYYAVADVFVFPTLGDPYGIVVDEAMACSLPVVATSAAGEIHARVQDGENGYVVEPGDSMAMADAMLKLSRDESVRIAMGRNSRKRVADHTPEQWASDFGAMVEALLPGEVKE